MNQNAQLRTSMMMVLMIIGMVAGMIVVVGGTTESGPGVVSVDLFDDPTGASVGETTEARPGGGVSVDLFDDPTGASVGETTEARVPGGRLSVDLFDDPTGASVDILNTMNESVVMHCWSRESDFGSMSFAGGANYYWAFHPNIFGRTVYMCSFLWKEWKQEFAVWKGSYHADRPRCCNRGPCSYKICPDGIYNALIVDTDVDGPAESWVLVEPWLENS